MLYSRDFVRAGTVGGYQKLDLTLVRNAVGSCSVTVPASHKKIGALLAPGARIVVNDDETGTQVFSGTIRSLSGSGPADESVTFTAQGDERVLSRMLGWPDPDKPITTQGAHDRYPGVALETVLKQVVSKNATRLGIPLTVATDQGRGGTVRQWFRFYSILERMKDQLDASDLTMSVRQYHQGLLLDVREAQTIRRDISTASGTLVSYDWDTSLFDSTRVVVGGQGVATEREFRTIVDAPREADLGWPEETFVDSRNTSDAEDLNAEGLEALTETRATSGLALELTESRSFRFGVHYNLGDRVTIQTAVGPITDRLREVRITADRNSGLQITPTVGERSDDPDAHLAKAIRSLRTRTTKLER